MKEGFDNQKYVEKQSEKILERINMFGGKLYLEFGGKLFDDYHASRVLPGFAPDAKVKLLYKLKDQLEILICISAHDIERKKIRADYGITYDVDVMRLIDNLRAMGIYVGNIVITQFEGQPSALSFKSKLEHRGEHVYIHTKTKGYPVDVDTIVSEEGYGTNPFIETTRPLVIVTAPGPGSGKLGTCLSQLYHEFKKGKTAGYAKFETFPVWNMPLKHPVNLAYEAATADLRDVNMIDPFHMEAYSTLTVNYNRDIEVFPVVKKILEKITGKECIYKSPTDMGVNMIGYFITDNESVAEASKQEIIRRYYKTELDYTLGNASSATREKAGLLMKELNLTTADRKVVAPCLAKAAKSGKPSIAVEMPNGKIITGKESELLSASAAVVLNFVKELANINDDIKLISPVIIEPILKLKKTVGEKNARLNLKEALIALSICAATNSMVEYALRKLPELLGREAHSSVILPPEDEEIFRRLRVNLTVEAIFSTKDLLF